jgi:hypothetical protein
MGPLRLGLHFTNFNATTALAAEGGVRGRATRSESETGKERAK